MVNDSKFLYSARVENKTPTPLTVIATYSQTLHPERTEELIQTLPSHASHTFGARSMSDSRLFISKFAIFDPDKNQREFEGPFVERTRDRETFEIHRVGKDDLALALKNSVEK